MGVEIGVVGVAETGVVGLANTSAVGVAKTRATGAAGLGVVGIEMFVTVSDSSGISVIRGMNMQNK